MANIEITNVDLGQIGLGDNDFEDGALVFAAADTVLAGTLLGRITASGKFAPCKLDATDGSEDPVAVLQYEVAATAAGDVPVRPIISGRVNLDRLVVHADGDGSNITAAVRDQLRSMSIIPLRQTQLAGLDNQ